MKKYRHTLAVRLVSGVLALLAGATTSARASAQEHKARIRIEDARATALSIVPGKIVAEELEREKGRWIYSFDIRPTGETRKIIKEVHVDADTGGQVGEVETEKG